MGGRTMELDPETSENCKHLCLFCYSHLPTGYQQVATLEHVVPFGDKLVIHLDNPSKNVQAFDLLCVLLQVDLRGSGSNNGSFDKRKSLPLCSRCQNVYQELFQLHVQIKELEKQLNKRTSFIRGLIEITQKGAELDSEEEVQSQLTLLGLDSFRKKVVGASSNETNESVAARKIPVPAPSPVSTSTATIKTNYIPPPPPDSSPIIVKEELEENFGVEDGAVWMGNGINETSNISHMYPSADESSMDAGNAFGEDDAFSNDDSGSDFKEDKVQNTTTIQTRRSTRNSAKSKSNDYFLNESSGSENEEEDHDDEQDYMNENDDENDSLSDIDDGDTSDEEFELPKSHKKSDIKSPRRKLRRVTVSHSIPTQDFECHICSVKIIGQRTIAIHYSTYHPEHKKYTCRFCQKHFRKLLDCLTHQRNKHTGEKPFQCPSCPSSFASKKLLKCHILQRHTDRSGITIPCAKCEMEFSTRNQLKNHLAAIHGHKYTKRSRAKNPPKTWKCHICDDVSITGYALFTKHYTDEHPDEQRYTCKFCKKHFNRYRECVGHQRKHTGERPIQCDICQKAYRDNKALAHHKRYVHRDNPTECHVCPTCGKKFSHPGTLNHHMYSHNEASIFCKMCGSYYKNPSYFARHNKKVHDGKAECSEPIKNPTKEMLASLDIPDLKPSVKCHRCWSVFATRTVLKKHFSEEHPDHQGGLTTCQCGKQFTKYKDCCRHAIRHNGTKTFQCDQCPLTFFSNTELKLHGRSHIPVEERKKHICDICGIGVVSEYALTTHKKTHDANQPRWVCEQCGKSYSRKKGLIHHTRMDHMKVTPFKCNHCGKLFVCANHLKKHERSHSKEKPYKCDLCDKRFPYSSSRTRHLREVHKVESEKKTPMSVTEEGRPQEETHEHEHKPDISFGGYTDTLAAL